MPAPRKKRVPTSPRATVQPGPVRILSVDGGGIRGIIPATILAHIEQETGKRISDLFHLIAGTSTGGIISLALSKPDSAGAGPPRTGASWAGCAPSSASSSTDTVDYQMTQPLPDLAGKKRYFRLQTRLDEGNDDMDDASKANLRALKFVAERIISDRKSDLNTIIAELKQPRAALP